MNGTNISPYPISKLQKTWLLGRAGRFFLQLSPIHKVTIQHKRRLQRSEKEEEIKREKEWRVRRQ